MRRQTGARAPDLRRRSFRAEIRGDEGWVLLGERGLGAALAWGLRAGVESLHVVADQGTGALARQASCFAQPPAVWRIEGTALVAAEADLVPHAPPAPDLSWADALRAAGADPVVDGGVLRGEVLGLEVAHVGPDGGLEVGVGKHDREGHLLAGHDASALPQVVRTVREHRVAGSVHELAMLAPERWLRHVVVERPELVGARALSLVAASTLPGDLRQPCPVAAAGVDSDGRPVLVVCSTGTDLEAVPAAADAWLADGRRPRLVLVAPATAPVVVAMAGLLAEPAEVVSVGPGWRALSVR